MSFINGWIRFVIHVLVLFAVQVNLFQKLATSAEHVVYQNCFECQNKTKTAICLHNMFCRYSELTIFMNILWVSWCKNKSFWQRFTCTNWFAEQNSLIIPELQYLALQIDIYDLGAGQRARRITTSPPRFLDFGTCLRCASTFSVEIDQWVLWFFKNSGRKSRWLQSM